MHLITTRSPYMGYFTRYPGPLLKAKQAGAGMKVIGLPELSLVLETPQGLVIIVGCSHSLVDHIVDVARRHLKKKTVALVMGGYHLLPYKEKRIRAIANRMKRELGVQAVAPCHCTGHLGQKVFREVFGAKFFPAGLGATVALPGHRGP
jgi:7,8-dihydropterin-6-yl-methyl-4-(beta-D-ribofuranosyl)aminobenzene 5'-phosphate synthase